MARSALTVVISGDATQLNRAFTRAEKDVDRLDKRTGTFSKRFASSMKVAGAAAGGALAIGLKQSVSAAVEAEKSQAKLGAQLKASGLSAEKYGSLIEDVIQKQSRMSGLDDEALTDSFTNIVRVTGDVTKSLELNAIAMDFARAKNIDVAKAGEIVGKVAGGNIGILSRYGITVKDGATATEALGLLQQKFEGQAKAYGDTTAGASDRAKVGFENLQEVVGERLAPALAKVANKFADLAEWAQKNPKEFKAITIAVGGLVAGLAALSVIGRVVAAFKVLRGAVIAVNIAMRANPIGLVITALTALGVGLVIAYKKSETFRNIVDGAFRAVKSVAVGAIQAVIKVLDALMGVWSTMLGALGRVPGFGWAKRAAESIDNAREKIRAFSRSLEDVPRVKDIKVNVKLKLSKQLKDIIDGKATGTLTAKMPTGDGLGVPAKGGSASLQGANRALSPLASIGSRMGLRVSSGIRPGAITSSGNISYHGSGEAIDMAGPPKAMLSYFKALKNFYGPRLAELIYTPGGQGIKNGRPFSYGGQVAADHNDHVHVALDLGKRGPGIGDGIGDAVRGARAAGFSGNELVTMVAIAGPESGYRDSARLVTSAEDSRGMWQINTKAHPWARNMNLTDTTTSARAARRVWQGSGRSWQPWTGFTSGAYRGFLDRAREAVVGSRSGSSRSTRPTSTRGASSTARPQTTAGRNPDARGTITTGAPSYEQDLAEADVGVAEADRAKDVARQVAAQKARRGVVRARLNKVTAALRKKNLRPATRLRLTQERAQLLGELGAVDSSIADLSKAPESSDDPNQALIDATQAWIDAVEAQREEARRIAEEAAERERERIASMNALRASLDAMTAFANQVSAITSMQAVRAMADMINGELGPRVVARQSMPGSGALASLGRS